MTSTLVVLVIISSFLGSPGFSPLGNILGRGSHSPWDRDQRDPRAPECFNCVSLEDSIDLFLHEDIEAFLLKAVSPFIPMPPDVLVDQGFVTSIFRPPASIL